MSCKVYPEMSCSIVVHPQTAGLSTPPISPNRASRQSRSPNKVGFVPHRTSSQLDQLQHSPVSPTSPAYQDVGEGLLQFDASRSMSPRRGELSESQSSFYDSDDIFSDFDTPVKLEQTFDEHFTPPKTPAGPAWGNRAPEPSLFVPPTTLHAPTITKPRVASHNVSHIVTLDDFAFRPSHILVRCGEWVRFRRPASQVHASLVCEGEFVSSEVNWPVEGDYLSLDHCFTNPGSFDVQNVIFTFCKCNVIVIPQGVPTAITGRKSAPPRLHGSFPSATVTPAQPVFHFPLTEEDKRSVKVPPRYSATTTTTVNATTTTTTISSSATSTANSSVSSMSSVVSVALSDNEAELTPSASPSGKPAAKGPSETTPLSRAVPLYGSFMNLSRNVPVSQAPPSGVSNSAIPIVPLDSIAEPAMSRYVNSLQTHEEGSDESDGADGEGNDAAAAARRKKKNQKKKEKLKLKQKLKKQAALESAAAEEAAEREPLLGGDVQSSTEKYGDGLQVDTNVARELRAGALDGERSPEMVIDKYLTDVTVSRSYLQAQIDWGEEIDEEVEAEFEAVLSAKQASIVKENLPVVPVEKAPLPPLPPSPTIPDPPGDNPPPLSRLPSSAALAAAMNTEGPAGEVGTPASKKKRNRSKNKRVPSPSAEDSERNGVRAEPDELAARMGENAPGGVAVSLPVVPSTPPRTVAVPPVPLPPPQPLPAKIEATQSQRGPLTSTAAQDGTNGANGAEKSVVLSPESFVTPTKTRKQRKERVDRASASSPAADKDASSVAAPATPQTATPAVTLAHVPSVEAPVTPAPQTRVAEDSASKRNSQLLRSVLRISPQREHHRDSPAPSVLFPGDGQPEKLPASAVPDELSAPKPPTEEALGAGNSQSEAHLSACFAFEQQMEEFFMSRKCQLELLSLFIQFLLHLTTRVPSFVQNYRL